MTIFIHGIIVGIDRNQYLLLWKRDILSSNRCQGPPSIKKLKKRAGRQIGPLCTQRHILMILTMLFAWEK